MRICIPLNTDNNFPGVKDQTFLNQFFWWEEDLQGSFVSFSEVLNVRADLGLCDRSDWLKFCLQWAQGRVWIQCGHVTTQGVSGKTASLNQEKAIYSTPGSKIEKIFQPPVPQFPTSQRCEPNGECHQIYRCVKVRGVWGKSQQKTCVRQGGIFVFIVHKMGS